MLGSIGYRDTALSVADQGSTADHIGLGEVESASAEAIAAARDLVFEGLSLMAKKRRNAHQGQFADSAAYAALSKEGKSLLEALQAFGREEILVEVEPGRVVNVRLSDKWRRFGAAAPENIERARRLVDLAEAAFEAERATKQ
jgi:hypothetical protein